MTDARLTADREQLARLLDPMAFDEAHNNDPFIGLDQDKAREFADRVLAAGYSRSAGRNMTEWVATSGAPKCIRQECPFCVRPESAFCSWFCERTWVSTAHAIIHQPAGSRSSWAPTTDGKYLRDLRQYLVEQGDDRYEEGDELRGGFDRWVSALDEVLASGAPREWRGNPKVADAIAAYDVTRRAWAHEWPIQIDKSTRIGELATKMQVAFNTVCEAVASSGAPAPTPWSPKFVLGQTVYPISQAHSDLPWIKKGQWACFQPSGAPVNEIRFRVVGFHYGLFDAHPNKTEADLFATIEEANDAAKCRNG